MMARVVILTIFGQDERGNWISRNNKHNEWCTFAKFLDWSFQKYFGVFFNFYKDFHVLKSGNEDVDKMD